MNTLKTIFVVGILVAVGYGVYMAITTNPTLASRGPTNLWGPPPQGEAPQAASPFAEVPASYAGASVPPAEQPDDIYPASPMPGDPQSNVGGAAAPPFSVTVPEPPLFGPGEAGSIATDDTMPPGAATVVPAADDEHQPNAPSGPWDGTAAPCAKGVRPEFTRMMDTVYEGLRQGKLVEALSTLTRFYGDPRLSPEEAGPMVQLLDQLAGTVIYDRNAHVLEPPYTVARGDTLDKIAQFHGVPPEMLANINGIRDPNNLPPGPLKVIRGPVDAVLHRDGFELVLTVPGPSNLPGPLYAGRFRVGVGPELPPEGTYSVKDKYGSPAQSVGGVSNCFIALDAQMSVYGGSPIGLHGAGDPSQIGRTGDQGSICLHDCDLRHLHCLLAAGSRVTITR